MRRMMLALAASLCVGPAGAEEPRRLEPVVVTATKTETPAERTGATVTVITREDIEAENQTRIEEVLREVPGVEIQRSGSLGKVTTIAIRGASGQQVQVLVDGMRVKSPTLGTLDLSELSLDDVERIEIVRGPQSTLHGADAIGGVVNVITRKGQGPPRGTLAVSGGSYGTVKESAAFQTGWRRFDLSLSASRYDSAGIRDNDGSDQTAAAGRVGHTFPWKGELSLTGRYARDRTEVPVFTTTPPPTVFDPNARQDTETWLYNLTYRQPVFPWWEVTLRHGQWWNDQTFRNPPPPGTVDTDSRIDTRRREFETVNTFRVGSRDTLTVGAEHRSERGEGRDRGSFPFRFREEIDTLSLFAQDELTLFDRLILGGGLRWEDNDTFGDELTPRASAVLLVNETGTRLRGAWGQGFRAPTINDLFFPGFGNPRLQPEHSESWEIGVDQRLWRNRVRLGATYFHNAFENLIQFVFDPSTFLFLPQNVGRARTEGVEVSAEVDPLRWVLLHGNYTFTDTTDLATGQPLRRFARHRWNAGVTVLPIERLSLFVEAHVVSSQLEAPGLTNPGHFRIDVGGTLRLLGPVGHLARLELTARVENLTDERYDEVFGFRAPGVNALVGLRARVQ